MSFYRLSAVSLTKSKPYTVEIVIQAMGTIGFPPSSGFYKPLQLFTMEEQDVLADAMTLEKRKLKELEHQARAPGRRQQATRTLHATSSSEERIQRNKATRGCNQ